MPAGHISVNYGLVDSTTDRIKAISGQMESNFADLSNLVNQVSHIFQGQAGTTYHTTATQLNKNLSIYKSSLDRLNTAVTTARHHIQGTDHAAAQGF